MLLEDYHILEKLGQFNREKIPERVVHARGMGAKGYFEVRLHISQPKSKRQENGALLGVVRSITIADVEGGNLLRFPCLQHCIGVSKLLVCKGLLGPSLLFDCPPLLSLIFCLYPARNFPACPRPCPSDSPAPFGTMWLL